MSVFVSYCYRDSDQVAAALAYARRSGVPWTPLQDVGLHDDWKDLVTPLIRDAPFLLLMTTRRSVASKNCQWELDLAVNEGVPVNLWVLDEACPLTLPEALRAAPVLARGMRPAVIAPPVRVVRPRDPA